jgi:cobalt-zinc-cadmium efflux system outer membrane protein
MRRNRTAIPGGFFISTVCVSALLLPAIAAAQPPLTLAAATERALAANPTIAAARLRGAVSQRALGVARERLNPELHVEIEREAPTRAYTVAVPLEAGGKRGRRIAVAEATIQVTEAELAVAIADTRASVRRAFFGRVTAELRSVLLDELQVIAGRARDTAQQRFDTGDAPRLEVLQADLAKSEADNQATAARGAATAASSTLNALLAYPLDAVVPVDTSLDATIPATLETAIAVARTASAELAVLDRRLNEQRARVALARAMQTPDVTPEAALTRGQPEFATGWRAAVTVAIPLLTHHRAGVAVEEAALEQLTMERAAALTRIGGEVTAAAVTADAQRQLFLRYQTQIIPQAVEVERMAEDSYRLGQTGIAALLQALQATRDVRLRSLQAAADLYAALADLERAIGAPLP